MNEARVLAEYHECRADLYSIQTAAELRRLSAEHEEDQKVIAVWRGRTQRAEAQRDTLLEALRWIATVNAMDSEYQKVARAAIKAVEG
jgi:hypothetical protein